MKYSNSILFRKHIGWIAIKKIFYEKIIEKVSRKDYKIGIVGMGYVGLPLALAFCKKDIVTLWI